VFCLTGTYEKHYQNGGIHLCHVGKSDVHFLSEIFQDARNEGNRERLQQVRRFGEFVSENERARIPETFSTSYLIFEVHFTTYIEGELYHNDLV
jgi:hypothetical protein